MVNATAVFRTFKYVRAQDVHLAEASSDDSHIQSLSREQALTEEMSPLLESSIDPPRADWVTAKRNKDGTQLPQAIAHRGNKAEFPENTMAAFRGAVNVGSHAIETDIHLSKDGIAVLSHDADLKRCFGKKEKIIDCNWDYLSTLRTTKEPYEKMPRLSDLLEYLASPGLEDVWTLLDIKLDNNADDVMRLIAETLESVSPSSSGRSRRHDWSSRVVLGIWAAKYLPLCATYLPAYPVAHIGFSTSYARQFLEVPNVSFNMLQPILLGPIGASFVRDVKAAGRQLFVWTVNDEAMMRWSIKKKVDGVITDEPKKFLDVCRDWDPENKAAPSQPSLSLLLWTFGLYILILVFGTLFRVKFPERVQQMVKKTQPPASRKQKGKS